MDEIKQNPDSGKNGSYMVGAVSRPLTNWVVAQAQRLMNRGSGPVPPSSPAAAAARAEPAVSGIPGPPAPAGLPAPRLQPMGMISNGKREAWFGPGTAPRPQAPPADVAGRASDYRVGINQSMAPREDAGVSFQTLRGLADAHDLVRLCIETRKDQMSKLTWSILPQQEPGQSRRPKADDRCELVRKRLRYPDRRRPWDQWLRMLLEEQLVIDAATIYPRKTVGGEVYSLEIVDGSTIKPLLDVSGREPIPPEAAYVQVLKGVPAIQYTADELLYMPRNPRPAKLYGQSVVEQIMLTVNIALRREMVKLHTFTIGAVPDILIGCPEEWTPEVVDRFQASWERYMADATRRAGAKFVPGKLVVQNLRSDALLQGPFDEWLARVICFAFSLPPTAFVQQLNRATAQTAQDTAEEEGLAPLMIWVKSVMDRIIQQVYGFEDLEFEWDDVEELDSAAMHQQALADMNVGVQSLDEIRAGMGLDPLGIPHFIMGIGPMGMMFVEDIKAAREQGLFMPQPPPPPQQFDEFGNPLPPDPAAAAPPAQLTGPAPPLALPAPTPNAVPMLPAPQPRRAILPHPAGADPLAGIPQSILDAVGLGAGPGTIAVTRADEIDRDPEMAHVPGAEVLNTLRTAEATNHERFAP